MVGGNMNIEEIKRPGQILDYVDTKEHLVEMFNYITNLQEENERLKENSIHNDKVVDKAIWSEMIYKSRIGKAIEQLEELYEIAKEQDSDNVNLIDRLEVILNILRGEDNE